MAFLPEVKATSDRTRMKSDNYIRFTDIFGILRQETKDFKGTIIPVFGMKVEKNLFMARLLRDKLHNICDLAATALNKQRMTFLEVKTLTGFLLFYAKVVRLGWVFMQLI